MNNTKNELLTRAVENVVPKELARKKLTSGTPMKIYLGIDPTGGKLHLGHSVVLRKLRAFQEAGHHIIFLIGSFTAMIGDPSGRDKMREVLTKEQVEENFLFYREQASKILDFTKLELRYNHEWLAKLSLKQVLEISQHFTVQQMLDRDMFQKRQKSGNPIALSEFFYPLMVGYDSVMLDVDCEIGGNDQLFNMLAGRTLQHALGKREKFVLTMKIIEGTDGRKMSKTYNNCVYLNDTPREMYGKIMSIPDACILSYMECCTNIPMKEVEALREKLQEGHNPRDMKMHLAREITTLYHSEEEARRVEIDFVNTFSKKLTPSDTEILKVTKGITLMEALRKNNLVHSNSEARRLAEQGGLKFEQKKLRDLSSEVQEGTYKIGKRKYVKILFI